MRSKTWLNVILAAAVFAGIPPAARGESAVSPMVPPAWLAGQLGSKQLVILDARPLKDYLAAHIPAAQPLLVDNLRSASAGVPAELFPPEVLSVVFGRLGITPGSTVVAYGQSAEPDAAYLASVLRLAGVQSSAVLDGGFARWTDEKRPTSTDRPPVSPTVFPVKPDASMSATIDDVRRASAAGSAILIDVRPKESYEKGHIPGAISRPFNLDYVAAGQPLAGTLRPAAELAAEYGALGVTAEKPAIVYCNSGHMASSTFYVLRHVLGYKDVRLYDGSWLEWSARTAVTPRPS